MLDELIINLRALVPLAVRVGPAHPCNVTNLAQNIDHANARNSELRARKKEK